MNSIILFSNFHQRTSYDLTVHIRHAIEGVSTDLLIITMETEFETTYLA